MKRENTAGEDMIREFAELKKQGISFFICTAYTSKRRYKPVTKSTAQGVSAYANKMYRKYGDNITIEVGYFDNDMNWKTYCTYHAQEGKHYDDVRIY